MLNTAPSERKVDLYEFIALFTPDEPWVDDGLCRRAGPRARWFTCEEVETVDVLGAAMNGRQAQIAATQKYCLECDVQWDCALWAVRNGEQIGVWAMVLRDLLWLQRFGGGDLVIEAARASQTPVQVMVRRVRRCVERDGEPSTAAA